MDHTDHTNLLLDGIAAPGGVWADFGAGTGAFTLALARLKESLGPEIRAKANAAPRRGRVAMWIEASRKPHLGILLMMLFLVPFAFSGIESTLAMWTERQFGWGARQNGWVYSYLGLVAVITQGGLIGPLTRLLGAHRLLLLAPVAVGVGSVAVALTTSTWVRH